MRNHYCRLISRELLHHNFGMWIVTDLLDDRDHDYPGLVRSGCSNGRNDYQYLL